MATLTFANIEASDMMCFTEYRILASTFADYWAVRSDLCQRPPLNEIYILNTFITQIAFVIINTT